MQLMTPDTSQLSLNDLEKHVIRELFSPSRVQEVSKFMAENWWYNRFSENIAFY